jgi:hypothetical protein
METKEDLELFIYQEKIKFARSFVSSYRDTIVYLFLLVFLKRFVTQVNCSPK